MKRTLLLPICILILGSVNAQVKCKYKCGSKEQVSIVNSADIKFSETPVSTVVYGPKTAIQEPNQVKHTYAEGTNCWVQLVTKLPKVEPVKDVKDINPTNLIPGYTERISAIDVPVTVLVNPVEKNRKPCIQTCCNCPCYDSDGNVVYHNRNDQVKFNFQPQDVKETENEQPYREVIDKQVITKTMAIQQPVDNVIIDARKLLVDPYAIEEGLPAKTDEPIAGLKVVETVSDNVNVFDGRSMNPHVAISDNMTASYKPQTIKGKDLQVYTDVDGRFTTIGFEETVMRDGPIQSEPIKRCKCKEEEESEVTIIEEELEVVFTESPENMTVYWGELEDVEKSDEVGGELKVLPEINQPVLVDELVNTTEPVSVEEEVQAILDETLMIEELVKPCKLVGGLEAVHIVSRRVEVEIVQVYEEPVIPVEEELEIPSDDEQDDQPAIEPIIQPVTSIGDMTVYPNPAINLVNVKWDGDDHMDMVHVFDMTGKLVRSERAYNNKVQFEKSDLTKGMYLVRAINQKGEVLKVDRFSFQ